MPKRYTIGKYVVVVLMLLIGFDFIFISLSWFVNTLTNSLNFVKNYTHSDSGPLSIFANFLGSTYSWLAFLFTNAIALATIIFISLIYEAAESRWK